MEKNKSGGKGAALRGGRKDSSSRKPMNTAGCTSAAGAQVERSWSTAGQGERGLASSTYRTREHSQPRGVRVKPGPPLSAQNALAKGDDRRKEHRAMLFLTKSQQFRHFQ